MTKKFWHLKSCALFERLSDDELKWIERASHARDFPRKSPIYLPADESRAVFLLASGRAKICHLTPDGKQSILAFIEPGELFGELALFEDGQRDEYAEAVEAVTVVMIAGDVFSQLLERRPEVTLSVTKMIGLRRKRIERRLKNLLFLPNRERLIHLLLELAEIYGQRAGGHVDLGIKLSHQDLANVIGSTRETVTVVLGELQNEGLLKVGRRRLTLTDTARLAASVQSKPPPLPAERTPEARPSTRQASSRI